MKQPNGKCATEDLCQLERILVSRNSAAETVGVGVGGVGGPFTVCYMKCVHNSLVLWYIVVMLPASVDACDLSCIQVPPWHWDNVIDIPLTVHDPDSKVHGANMGPTWVLSAPGGPHVGPINFAIREACKIWMKQPVQKPQQNPTKHKPCAYYIGGHCE